MSNLFKHLGAIDKSPPSPAEELSHTSILALTIPCQPDHRYLHAHAIEDIPCHVYLGFWEKNGVGYHGAILFPIYDAAENHVDTTLIQRSPGGRETQVCVNDRESKGCFVRLGRTASGTILIVSDVASAASLHLATGFAVAAAGDEQNLTPVCQALAEAYPDHQRILCLGGASPDIHGAELCKVANDTGTLISYLNEADQNTRYKSYNDQHLKHGLDAVARRIAKVSGNTVAAEPSQYPFALEWPYPISGRRLIRKLTRAIERHTVLDAQQAIAIALWIIFSYSIPTARIAPILLIASPVRRCGKSTLGALLSFLVCKAVQSSSITPAALFRAIEEECPTILIDEADTFLVGATELTGIINSGHTRSAAFATRIVGGRSKRFSTFCAKVLMMIGLPPETILDRSIKISLMRKRPDQKVERLGITPSREFAILKAQIAKWVDDNRVQIAEATFEPAELGNDRASDNWEPLLAIAKCIGDEWYEAALDSAIELSQPQVDQQSPDELLLEDIQDVFAGKSLKKISSAELIKALCTDPEKPWSTIDRGRPLSQSNLAARLGKFGIRSKNIRQPQGVAKGYELEQFADAFARYVSASP